MEWSKVCVGAKSGKLTVQEATVADYHHDTKKAQNPEGPLQVNGPFYVSATMLSDPQKLDEIIRAEAKQRGGEMFVCSGNDTDLPGRLQMTKGSIKIAAIPQEIQDRFAKMQQEKCGVTEARNLPNPNNDTKSIT